jgi:uncharacterized protein with NRDE domain
MYTEAQKKASYKWREKNKESYNIYIAEQMKKQYEKNREEKIKKVSDRYFVKQEFRKFLNILI